MDIPKKQLVTTNKTSTSLSDDDQKKKESTGHQERKIFDREDKASSDIELKQRRISTKKNLHKSKHDECNITQEKLSKKGIMSVNNESELMIASLLFSAMNNLDNPLFTFPSGGATPTAEVEVLRLKSELSLESFDELDLFIKHHTHNKMLDLRGASTEDEIKSTFERYGVLLINGLNPEKNSTLIIGCGHNNDHSDHSFTDTIDIRAKLKPDALLQWGDERATQYLGTLNKYHEIIDEGPLVSFMNYSKEYFSAARSCLIIGGKLHLPKHILQESNIPEDFIKDKDVNTSHHRFGARHVYATYTYSPT